MCPTNLKRKWKWSHLVLQQVDLILRKWSFGPKNIFTLCVSINTPPFLIESTSLVSKTKRGFDWTRLTFLSEAHLLTIELAFPFANINVDLFSPKFYRCQKKKLFTAQWPTLAFFSHTCLHFCSSFKFPLSQKLTIRSSISVRNIELLSNFVKQPRAYES